MLWEVYVQHANGKEEVVRIFEDLEVALNCVDRIYLEGYPMHLAYLVRAHHSA